MAESVVVLGIDPGTLVTGFGAVSREGEERGDATRDSKRVRRVI